MTGTNEKPRDNPRNWKPQDQRGLRSRRLEEEGTPVQVPDPETRKLHPGGQEKANAEEKQ